MNSSKQESRLDIAAKSNIAQELAKNTCGTDKNVVSDLITWFWLEIDRLDAKILELEKSENRIK
jgi:hypothetical protein